MRPIIIGRIYFGTPGGNRTHNCPLGGGCYIHLTKETSTLIIMYLFIITDVVIIAISFDKIVKNFAGEILYIPEATPLL